LRSEESDEKNLARAKSTAYRYLTYRPRSTKELLDKLSEKKFDVAVINAVLADLTRLGYLDDAQFAAQWASSRLRLRGFGRRRIEQELKQKGVDQEIIRGALAIAIPPEDEIEAARSFAERKLRTMKSFEPEVRRRRLAGFLERKGFSYDIIREMLSHIT
jgi:regulatory protein